MRTVLFALTGLLLVPTAADAQVPATDIIVLSMPRPEAADFAIQAKNITNRPGYDNQPTFTPDGRALLYSSIRGDDQADVYRFDLETGTTTRLTRTPESEFSPTPLPGGSFSTVRIEADSTQRLRRFRAEGGVPEVVTDVSSVGYHAWLDTNLVALFIVGEPHTLQIVNLTTGRIDTVAANVGRSIHRVPGSHAVSYVDRSDERRWVIRSFDPTTGARKEIATTLPEREDYAWTPDGTLLMAEGPVLFRWSMEQERWLRIASLEGAGITDIGRIAVSPAGDRLALVVHEAAEP